MKPHFGQSDAAMNKLAGCNVLPNNNKPADLARRDIPCSCIPCKHYESSLDEVPCKYCRDHAKFEEKDFDPVKERDAAYDLGYKDAIKALTAEKPNREVQFWKDETRRAIEAGDTSYVKAVKLYGSTVELADKYRAALHIIAHMGISGLSWQHDYEKCVNIAKEALEGGHAE